MMYLRALQGYEKTMEPELTSKLPTVNSFGNIYTEQKKLAEAMHQGHCYGMRKQWGLKIYRYCKLLTTWATLIQSRESE